MRPPHSHATGPRHHHGPVSHPTLGSLTPQINRTYSFNTKPDIDEHESAPGHELPINTTFSGSRSPTTATPPLGQIINAHTGTASSKSQSAACLRASTHLCAVLVFPLNMHSLTAPPRLPIRRQQSLQLRRNTSNVHASTPRRQGPAHIPLPIHPLTHSSGIRLAPRHSLHTANAYTLSDHSYDDYYQSLIVVPTSTHDCGFVLVSPQSVNRWVECINSYIQLV